MTTTKGRQAQPQSIDDDDDDDDWCHRWYGPASYSPQVPIAGDAGLFPTASTTKSLSSSASSSAFLHHRNANFIHHKMRIPNFGEGWRLNDDNNDDEKKKKKDWGGGRISDGTSSCRTQQQQQQLQTSVVVSSSMLRMTREKEDGREDDIDYAESSNNSDIQRNGSSSSSSPSTAGNAVVDAQFVRRNPHWIVLVDDEESIRLSVGDFLYDAGFQVTACDSAESLLTLLSSSKSSTNGPPHNPTGATSLDDRLPDAIVSDVRMPGGMDGVELLRTLRQTPQHERIPDNSDVQRNGSSSSSSPSTDDDAVLD
eukprot:CAMPEP_0168733558 /NCGR_PEP_ID=MMETSP0724-20121128/8356_1 /TAXON_ID=265536 /ORGANISM="Amphiprora sp., Strain CCMP467" /LENGTH=310 /DNA_ID=CAMNT_0008780627 /DNA_START=400 /DNA_END=1332 /DNA_ORIENTATION=-